MTEQASFTLRNRNPDVLTCIANLSNDEVFTPPELANKMLDTLAEAWAKDNKGENIWENKDVKFLDPCTKSGVFLREITSRLTQGLEKKIPNLDKRVDHILSKQVYGIGITKLTSLLARRSVYCSKTADGEHSIAKSLKSKDGNIWYENQSHSWLGDKCQYCGCTKSVFGRSKELESHAYALIHNENPKQAIKKIFGDEMQFDVIIGNPPYQLNDGGGTGTSASPIYHQFVLQTMKLEPKYFVMVIPSRWYAGGKGLNDFRNEMLNCSQIKILHDFPTATDVFPGVDIAGGVCYFLWSKNLIGDCEVINHLGDELVSDVRRLNEFPTFIRDNKSVSIVRKIHLASKSIKNNLSERISPRKPFGLASTYKPSKSGIQCWFSQKIGKSYANKSDVTDNLGILNSWKVLIPFAPIAGQTDFTKAIGFYYEANTRIAQPGECCTETYLVAGAFSTKKEAENFKSYLFTKIVRFLLLQAVTSQNITRQYFYLIPDLGVYNLTYSDSYLIKKWGLSDSDWEIIDKRIS